MCENSSPPHETKRSWLRQLSLVFVTFTALGFSCSLILFLNAPQIWPGSVLSGCAAGLAGCLAWMLICQRLSRPPWWRTIAAGILSGVLVHPIYLGFSVGLSGEWFTPGDLLVGSMFLLLIAGIITVPAGIVAATICRIAGSWHDPNQAR